MSKILQAILAKYEDFIFVKEGYDTFIFQLIAIISGELAGKPLINILRLLAWLVSSTYRPTFQPGRSAPPTISPSIPASQLPRLPSKPVSSPYHPCHLSQPVSFPVPFCLPSQPGSSPVLSSLPAQPISSPKLPRGSCCCFTRKIERMRERFIAVGVLAKLQGGVDVPGEHRRFAGVTTSLSLSHDCACCQIFNFLP